ncbi:MAG: 30S ribosomal protein S18 [Candidatus Omnitrophica bacterium]|nr:30S ribosomal protein S18 [Candidatus Omnitrophota bacterium]
MERRRHPTDEALEKKKPFRKKVCKFCLDRVERVDYRDALRLAKFTSERGKILPRRVSGTCAHHQRQLSKAIKRARVIALSPFSAT